MRVMAQLSMVMNLDKCIGCHTCSVTCKQAWTNRAGVEYVWFNNVETRPGQGYPAPLSRPRNLARGLDAQPARSSAASGRRPLQKTAHHFRQLGAAKD
jgi:nitrate reductase / nitrite oxidoreductase, beta subunit